MKILGDKKGRISLLELVIIIALVLEGLFLLSKSFGWLGDKASGGDDRFLENTAESVARVNSLNGMSCPVDGCMGNDCVHRQGSYYVGYFDDISHKIFAYPKKGYNQNASMHIGKKKYYGEPGTMVIQVRCKDGTVELDWVEGAK